jgi:phosphoglycerol transferase
VHNIQPAIQPAIAERRYLRYNLRCFKSKIITSHSSMENEKIVQYIKRNFLFIAIIVIFFALVFRNSGLYPIVMGDEYSYSLFSRLLPFADSTRPDYIYSLIYHVTNICGDGFYDCARILNVLFFVSATPFIYLVARRVSGRKIASLVALLAIIGPINSYTAYFMPESLYFLSFWIFAWFILRLENSSSPRSWCIGGIILGLSALIKPHALLLLPAVIIYIAYVSRKKEKKWAIQAFKNAGLLIALTFFTKLMIGYIIAGKTGLTIFGSDYTMVVSSSASNFQHYLELLRLAVENIGGHALAMCLMFGVPIAIATNLALKSMFSKEEVKTEQKVSFFALAVLIDLILVTGLYAAMTVNSGPYESIMRLSMRYYNFAFPLLLIIVASQLSLESVVSKLKWRIATAIPIGTIILYAIYTHLVPYTPGLADSPELRGITFNPTIFYILGGMSFLSLVLWVYKARSGAKIFIYIFMPLTIIFSTFFINHELRQRLIPDVYDKAGIFTKQYLTDEELSKVLIIGSEPAGLLKSMFHLDNSNASYEIVPAGSAPYNLSELPVNKEWILAIGDHVLSNNTFYQFPMDGFILVHATSTITLDFRKASWPGVISNTIGLSSPEVWGTWSTGNVVTLEFSTPLPEKFAFHLMAGAFGPNVGKDFVAHVGDNAVKFKLTALPEEKVLEFNNPQKSRVVKIDIPSPISPKELGLSGDERNLGIGFTEIKIIPL